jgi:hypothetical protein
MTNLYFEWKDILHCHNYNIHNNRLLQVLKFYGNFRIHKKTGRNWWAWFLIFDVRSLDR